MLVICVRVLGDVVMYIAARLLSVSSSSLGERGGGGGGGGGGVSVRV